MVNSGLNNAALKQQNRGLILRLVATGKCSSRIEIARETGLSKMAATNIIGEFIDDGIIIETDKQVVGGKGRNPVMLTISPKAPKIIGVHITRNVCGVSLCTFDMKVIESVPVGVTEENHDRLIENIFQTIDGFLERYAGEKIAGIGVGTLGPVNSLMGKVLDPPNFYGLHDINLLDMMKERYELPVFVEQEYDCAALTELYFGVGKGMDEFFFIGISWGVGGGIVANGQLYRSRTGFTCEFGHTCIDYNGPVCNCGRHGCVETYTSTLKVEEKLRDVSGEKLSFKEFCRKYENDAPEKVDAVFTDMALKLSYGITNMVNAAGNVNYIIGHEGCCIPDRYLRFCEKMVNERIMFRNHRRVRIIKSEIHNEVLSSSCAVAVLYRIFRGEI